VGRQHCDNGNSLGGDFLKLPDNLERVKRLWSDSRTQEDINNQVQSNPPYEQYLPLSQLDEKKKEWKKK